MKTTPREPTRFERVFTAPPLKSIKVFNAECLTPAVSGQKKNVELNFWQTAFRNLEPLLAGLSMHELLRDPEANDYSAFAMKSATHVERLLKYWQHKNSKSKQFQLSPEGVSLFFGLRETIMIFSPRYLRELKPIADFDAIVAYLELKDIFSRNQRVLALLERYAFDEQAMQYILEAAGKMKINF